MELTLIYTIVGFALAGWSVIANDSIQTLGTFIASKQKWFKWYTLAGRSIFSYDCYSKLWLVGINEWRHFIRKINTEFLIKKFNGITLLLPGILLLLTRIGIPVSTTFLVLSAFASTVVLEKMLIKSVVGLYHCCCCSLYLLDCYF